MQPDPLTDLLRRPSVVADLSAQIARHLRRAGVSVSDGVAAIHRQREAATRERYGDAFVDGLRVPERNDAEADA